MNIMDYAKSNAPIKRREEVLFDTIKRLDTDSFEVFKEVMDLKNGSLYRVEDLTAVINELMLAYHNSVDALAYIQKIERDSNFYSRARFLLRIAGNTIVIAAATIIHPILGLISLVKLNSSAIKKYGEEIKNNIDLLDDLDYLDENKLRIIATTLDNSERILSGKNNRAQDLDNYYYIFEANLYIKSYIDGNSSIEEINRFPDYIKSYMCTILQNELDSQDNDLESLLNLAKSKHKENMLLLKAYK